MNEDYYLDTYMEDRMSGYYGGDWDIGGDSEWHNQGDYGDDYYYDDEDND